jgi:hypothetical protein
MVSTVRDIIKLTKESDLIKEMEAFELAAAKRIAPVEELLDIDIRSGEEITIQNHMSKVDSYRQTSVRIFGLTACFLEHAKSPYFALDKGTEFQRNSKQKQLIAPFMGMFIRFEGLIKSIDSRVNLCKVLLRVSNEGMGSSHIPG